MQRGHFDRERVLVYAPRRGLETTAYLGVIYASTFPSSHLSRGANSNQVGPSYRYKRRASPLQTSSFSRLLYPFHPAVTSFRPLAPKQTFLVQPIARKFIKLTHAVTRASRATANLFPTTSLSANSQSPASQHKIPIVTSRLDQAIKNIQ